MVDHFLFNVHSIHTIFYGSDWRIWRSADLRSYIWNQHYHSSFLDLFTMDVRYQRTSISEYRSRSQIHSKNVEKNNCWINSIPGSYCNFISKYSIWSHTIYIDTTILSHTYTLLRLQTGPHKVMDGVNWYFVLYYIRRSTC
jgi:hypothetical protein